MMPLFLSPKYISPIGLITYLRKFMPKNSKLILIISRIYNKITIRSGTKWRKVVVKI